MSQSPRRSGRIGYHASRAAHLPLVARHDQAARAVQTSPVVLFAVGACLISGVGVGTRFWLLDWDIVRLDWRCVACYVASRRQVYR